VSALFELGWLGGAAERSFAAHRGDVDDLPWGRFDRSRYPLAVIDQARLSWTVSAQQEWSAAAGFAALLSALLEAGAPVDLIGMAGRFVADEMVHTELNARMAAEVGGGVPVRHDPGNMVAARDPGLSSAAWACELAIRIGCVGETFALPILSGVRDVTTDPLVRAVLSRIVKDEGPHGRIGWLVLDWALPRLNAAEREHLGGAATDAIDALTPLWSGPDDIGIDAATQHALGWMTPPVYREVALRAVSHRVREPLRARGLHVT
jgi:hypothetical protein